MIAKQLHITGKVQGVFYRKTAKEMAQKLNIIGWIKNEKDDTVSAVIQGESDHIEQYILWCKKGPDNANVQEVIIKDIPLSTSFHDFKIIH